jgi:hypothetical protein
MHVSVPCMHVCVASQYPLFHKVFIYLVFKSNYTACMSPCLGVDILYESCSIVGSTQNALSGIKFHVAMALCSTVRLP